MDKYVCVGTHGGGKTTLTYQISTDLKRKGSNVYLLQEKVRHSPFPINDKMKPETSIWASSSHIAEELTAQARGFDALVADRSPYDTFLYAKHFGLDHPSMGASRKLAFNWFQSYKKIIWVRPDQPIQEDGIRSTDLRFQEKIDALFEQFFDTFPEIPKEIIWTSEIFLASTHSSLDGSLLS